MRLSCARLRGVLRYVGAVGGGQLLTAQRFLDASACFDAAFDDFEPRAPAVQRAHIVSFCAFLHACSSWVAGPAKGFCRVFLPRFDPTEGRRHPGRIGFVRAFDPTLRRRHAGWTARSMSSRR